MGIIERSSRPIRTLATSLAVAGGVVLVLLALLTGLREQKVASTGTLRKCKIIRACAQLV